MLLDLLALVSVVLSQCSSIKVHKEWRELTKQEQTKYLTAIKCLREQPSKLAPGLPKQTYFMPSNRWDDFTYIHATVAPHGDPAFLPWHRVFLALIDKAMADECSFSGPFPYWDWSIDSEAPEKSEIWKSFGTSGCLELPIVGKLTTKMPSLHCTSRLGDLPKTDVFSPEQLGLIMNRKSFEEFSEDLENDPHGAVHSGLGGDMGQPQTSPNDPIFYLHHRNVDRLWTIWQNQNPELANEYTGERWDGMKARDVRVSLDDLLDFDKVAEPMKVRDAFNTKSGAGNGLMCFEYSNSIAPAAAATNPLTKRDLSKRFEKGIYNTETPSASDRSHLYNLRIPNPIPERYLKEWMFSKTRIEKVRRFEIEVAEFTKFINQQPILFSTSLKRQQLGQSKGWVPKSNEKAAADALLVRTLVEAFEAQQDKKQ